MIFNNTTNRGNKPSGLYLVFPPGIFCLFFQLVHRTGTHQVLKGLSSTNRYSHQVTPGWKALCKLWKDTKLFMHCHKINLSARKRSFSRTQFLYPLLPKPTSTFLLCLLPCRYHWRSNHTKLRMANWSEKTLQTARKSAKEGGSEVQVCFLTFKKAWHVAK